MSPTASNNTNNYNTQLYIQGKYNYFTLYNFVQYINKDYILYNNKFYIFILLLDKYFDIYNIYLNIISKANILL
jgi:hypothetical protein